MLPSHCVALLLVVATFGTAHGLQCYTCTTTVAPVLGGFVDAKCGNPFTANATSLVTCTDPLNTGTVCLKISAGGTITRMCSPSAGIKVGCNGGLCVCDNDACNSAVPVKVAYGFLALLVVWTCTVAWF